MNYEEFKETFGIADTFQSENWALGGNRRDCWGADYQITPETPLTSFEEFDELIEKINPHITFIQYKNIYNRCVNSETTSDSDYYGGTAYYGYYECNTHNLYEELKERNLL